MDSKNENTPREKPWQERVWVVAVAGQAGIYIAFPVLLGMAVGFFIDRQFGTYILFSVLLSMAGFGAGIFLVYRWVKTSVQQRLDEMKKEE